LRTFVTAAIVSLAICTVPPVASGAVSCAFVGGTATVTMSAGGDSALIAVGTGTSAGRIMLGATACGAATTSTTDTIVVVSGNTGAEAITIDLSGGPFAPGASVEGTGSSEIEFAIDLGAGTQDRLTVTGGPGNDSIVVGTLGANLNGDDDVDVTPTGVELGTVNASDGADTVSGAGNASTGGPSSLLFTFNGESGNDTLSGGSGDDTITGGTGSNILAGGAGDDTLTGGQGNDTITGGPGGDTQTGGLGNDAFDEGAATGTDTMAGGGGIDTVTYAARANGATVTMDGVADDGELGEADNVGADIENAVGGPGDDTLIGSSSANDLVGAAGDDTIDGAGGGDTLAGGSGSDRLTGGAGADTVAAGDGSDTVLEGAGNDDLEGGAGGDTLDYSGVATAMTLTLSSFSPQNTVGAGIDTLVAFENLVGGTAADTLGGDGNANVLSGNSGNDTIIGDGGDDTISGDLGTDTVDYSSFAGAVTIVLAPATGATPGTSTGAAGTDSLLDIENVSGGAGDDVLTGEIGANVLSGNGGNDSLAGLEGNDTLDGGGGPDTLDYSATGTGVTVNLTTTGAQNTVGAGSDTITAAENVTGSSFPDTLIGNTIDNTLLGGGGDDTLAGGAGDDTLAGGAEIDTADYASAGLGVAVDLSLAGAQNTGRAGIDTLTGIENLAGGAGRDALRGDAGANIITGGAGNDALASGGGGDLLDGGTGADVADYSAEPLPVTINLTTGSASSSGATDTLIGLENATGGAGADSLTGDGGANVLLGGDGGDALRGLGGDDTLAGGPGSDRLAGFAGDDALIGDGGSDTVDYSSFFSANLRVGVIVDLGLGQATGDGADSVSGVENVLGSGFDDRLMGSGDANVLTGGAGNDVIGGRADSDRLSGGVGRDLIYARDRVRDDVFGGKGPDVARIDRGRDHLVSVGRLLS
jgi:Ca2+-binding RTX toxin-like protein